MSYRKILVPIDGSATANRGLREAIRLAKEQNASIQAVHVVDGHYVAMAAPEAAVNIGELLPEMRKSGKRILDKAAQAIRAQGVRCTTALVETFTGTAADCIVRQAKKWRPDVIVIGTHGRRGIRRLLLGSDAEQVVRASPVPVLLVRAR